VRADVEARARDDGGNEDARSASFETRVIALPPADSARVEAAQDTTLHQPRLGELEWQGIFLDWRAWNLGPCAVRLDDPALMRQLDDACVAAENGDWQGATTALQTALDLTDDRVLTATLRGHIGMLAAVAETWNVAVRNFREALDLWTMQGDSLAVAITLHNLGIVLIKLEQWEEGSALLSQGWRLRDEIGDYTGNALTWGQFGLIWDDRGTVEGASSTLRDYGMTLQSDVLVAWLELNE
jgi:tetratricopeptide (TPR) repeat protein